MHVQEMYKIVYTSWEQDLEVFDTSDHNIWYFFNTYSSTSRTFTA